jgi:hypothetical protein
MLVMLCRNRVKDYDTWRSIFDSNAAAQRAAGLELAHLWRDTEDPNNVFFVLKVADRKKAEAFISAPEAAETERISGVLDGEYRFLEGA